MKINLLKYKFVSLFLVGLSMGLLASCSESEIIPENPDMNPIPEEMVCEGFELGIPVAFDADIPSPIDAADDLDDYVETKDHFRVFFFDQDGNFIVNPMDRTVTPLGTDNKGRKKFYIRIPFNYIVDRNENVFDVEAIKKKLKDQPFKVAILANWPNPNSENLDTDRDPNWGWRNSKIYQEQYEELTKDGGEVDSKKYPEPALKTIFDLHHLQSYEGDIYSDYISEDKLSKTVDWIDNEGNAIMLDESKNILIPMYGVQNYAALEGWTQGTTFNLSGISDTDDKDAQNIYLLRSVAKIEVYFEGSTKPKDVTIHNINRTSRCEPMDVFTPTDQIWLKDDGYLDHTSLSDPEKLQKDRYCEWYLIGNHGLFSENNYDLSWFYRNWGKSLSPDEGESSSEESPNILEDSPHIFNENFDNVESVSLNYQGKTEEGELFVIYMPEKYMHAPNESENCIPYIDFAYEVKDTRSRFYLTDKQPASTKIEDVVNAPLWPIMRNHKYTFYVGEPDKTPTVPTIMRVRARVSDWNYEKIENTDW